MKLHLALCLLASCIFAADAPANIQPADQDGRLLSIVSVLTLLFLGPCVDKPFGIMPRDSAPPLNAASLPAALTGSLLAGLFVATLGLLIFRIATRFRN